jgi:choline transport protein
VCSLDTIARFTCVRTFHCSNLAMKLPADTPTAEEIQDASLTLPRAIMWSAVSNAVLSFIMAVTLIFTLGDIQSVLETPTFQPFIQVFFNATQSYAGTNVMTTIVIILLVSCCISEVATASRQIWSFARDKGLPGSNWLSRVSWVCIST